MSATWDLEMPDFFAKSRIERFCSVRNRSIRVATFLIIVGVYVSIIILSFHFFMFLSMKYGSKLQKMKKASAKADNFFEIVPLRWTIYSVLQYDLVSGLRKIKAKS